jgi:Helix-turn-helix domain
VTRSLLTSREFAISVPDELLEALAQRAAAIVLERQREEPAARWLYGARAAAEYLGWPVKRVTNKVAAGAIPHHRNGGRLMFNTSELDRRLRDSV